MRLTIHIPCRRTTSINAFRCWFGQFRNIQEFQQCYTYHRVIYSNPGTHSWLSISQRRKNNIFFAEVHVRQIRISLIWHLRRNLLILEKKRAPGRGFMRSPVARLLSVQFCLFIILPYFCFSQAHISPQKQYSMLITIKTHSFNGEIPSQFPVAKAILKRILIY